MGFFEKLKSGLTKTRQNFTDRITELVGMSAKVDEDFQEKSTGRRMCFRS